VSLAEARESGHGSTSGWCGPGATRSGEAQEPGNADLRRRPSSAIWQRSSPSSGTTSTGSNGAPRSTPTRCPSSAAFRWTRSRCATFCACSSRSGGRRRRPPAGSAGASRRCSRGRLWPAYRSGDNPARWKGNLSEMLAKPGKVAAAGNWPALSLDDAPRWWRDLSKREGMAAAALRFATMTAARSGEVRGATWGEIDLDKALWTIPAARMKARREHRVPLTVEAVLLLRSLPRMEGSEFVFFAPRGGALSDMSISAVMRRMQEAEEKAGRPGYVDPRSRRPAVPHGLRSTFRDWAAEHGFDRDLAEIALAHSVGSEVERAYRRTDMLERRRAMLGELGAALPDLHNVVLAHCEWCRRASVVTRHEHEALKDRDRRVEERVEAFRAAARSIAEFMRLYPQHGGYALSLAGYQPRGTVSIEEVAAHFQKVLEAIPDYLDAYHSARGLIYRRQVFNLIEYETTIVSLPDKGDPSKEEVVRAAKEVWPAKITPATALLVTLTAVFRKFTTGQPDFDVKYGEPYPAGVGSRF
jgi:integrase